MKTVVGVFKSRSAAEHGSAGVMALGISKDKINILTPEATEKELAQVSIVTAEQPGIGKAMGATVGGAIGLASAGALGSLLVPVLVPSLRLDLQEVCLERSAVEKSEERRKMRVRLGFPKMS